MTVVFDGTVPAAHERVIGPGNPRSPIRHAEDPNRPGHGLCGAKLRDPASPAGDRCVVCRDLTSRSFLAR